MVAETGEMLFAWQLAGVFDQWDAGWRHGWIQYAGPYDRAWANLMQLTDDTVLLTLSTGALLVAPGYCFPRGLPKAGASTRVSYRIRTPNAFWPDTGYPGFDVYDRLVVGEEEVYPAFARHGAIAWLKTIEHE